jgi:diguanylate cyclase (GGDEF)-like protein
MQRQTFLGGLGVPRLLIACCLLSLAGIAVPRAAGQRQLFQSYGSALGLRNLNVKCLAQDHVGYLWVGTDNGLFRFDGTKFREFGHADGLADTEILTVVESPDGVLWAGTNGGVAALSGDRFHAVDSGEHGRIRGIVFPSSGDVYLEGDNGIIRGVATGHGSYSFHPVMDAPANGLSAQGDRVFFGRDGGIWELTGDKANLYQPSLSLPKDEWSAMVEDDQGNEWVRSRTRLFELPRGQSRFVDQSAHVPHAPEAHLYADRHGSVFVTTMSGTIVIKGTERSYFDVLHGMPAQPSGPMLVDRDQLLWMGTDGGGLVRRRGHGEWLAWKEEDGLVGNPIWAIKSDRKGNVWVGSNGGLTIFDPNGRKTQSWTDKNGFGGDRVLSLAEAPNGEFYVGTDIGNISRFSKDGHLLHTYGTESGYRARRVSSMTLDREGRLWAVGVGGCFRSRAPVDRGHLSFLRMDVPGITATSTFRDVLADDQGSVWIASSRGLARFNGSVWRVFTEKDGLKSSDLGVVSLAEGSIWVGYRDALGMTRFDLPKMIPHHITMVDGVGSDQIYAVQADHRHRVWATTDAGVSVLDGGIWSNYSSEDGLVWNDTDSLALNVDAQDNIWIGTSGGMAKFAQTDIASPQPFSPVVLTSLLSAAHEWSAADHPTLSYFARSLSIRFAALRYDAKSTTRFRYRLVGLDNKWTETSEQGVDFAALPPGDYLFEVTAAGAHGEWNPVTAHFAFSIESPWWRTWWFIATALAAIVLLTATAVRLRIRALEAQKRALEQQVADRTAELVTSHKRLEEIAYRDMLTSTWNRRMFVEELRDRTAGAKHVPFTLLLLDLDFFKQVNDTFGHDAGDAVLVETASRLKHEVRCTDLVARLGGDEFAILLREPHDATSTERLCHRVLQSLARPIAHKGVSVSVACSIGIARFPKDGDSQESLYKSADLALYKAKKNSRNAFFWHRKELLVDEKDWVDSASTTRN